MIKNNINKKDINLNNRRRRIRRNRINRRRMRGNRRLLNRNRVINNRLNYINRIKRLNNNNNNKNNNNNNINNKIIKTNNKIDKLSEDLNKLSLSLFPKTTNIFRKLKEPRIDKYVTPMEMGLSHRFTSVFKTGNRIRYMSLYNRFEIDNSNIGFHVKYMWFPYSVNFQSYPDLTITVSDGEEGSTQPNMISPLMRVVINNNISTIEGMTVYDCASCGLVGNYRLVGASLKITNLSPFNTKAGSYIIYKLNENTTYPPFYKKSLSPTLMNSPRYANLIGILANENHDQVMLKQSFSASDVGYIHEYNIYEGNNIFQTPNEYIGEDYISGLEPVATWNGNPQGNNIKYEIDIPSTATTQSYLIETWQILEIVPDPSLNLDNITDFQTHVFNEDVLDEIRRKMPIVKGHYLIEVRILLNLYNNIEKSVSKIMSVAHKNLARHVEKLKKSIDNKLFDLLIDLDDENHQEYQFKDLNIIIKYYIITKILLNKRCNELLKISDKTIQQDITIGKSKDNLIYITDILVKNRFEPPKGINSYILCNNNYNNNDIIKKYMCNIKPLIEYMHNKNINSKYKLDLYSNKISTFNKLNICNKLSISYNNINNNNLKNSNFSIFNNDDIKHKNEDDSDFGDDEEFMNQNNNNDNQQAPPLIKISDMNNLAFNNIDEYEKKYINEKEEIKIYNNINPEDMSEKEQLKLAIELSKKEYLNKMIQEAPKLDIDPLTGSITLTHKQKDRMRYYNNNKK